MKHYDESELIEVHFLPAEHVDARSHIAGCAECADRMASLADSLRAHAAGPENAADAMPEFFWERQSVEIRRKISRGNSSHNIGRLISIAAMLVLLVGASFLAVRRHSGGGVPATPSVVATTTASASTHATTQDDILLDELQSDRDAWSTDQLKPYHSAVEWESWLSTDQTSSGGRS